MCKYKFGDYNLISDKGTIDVYDVSSWTLMDFGERF